MKKNTLHITCIACLTIVLLSGCYYDNEEELYGTQPCETDHMSYQLDIVPIIETSCFPCHRNDVADGSVRLGNHSELMVWVNNGSLLGAIKHESGFSPMPKIGHKLSDCTIAKIESWIADGAPEN